MCGILGAISTSTQLNIDRFRSALLCMNQRGPDAHGVFQHNDLWLGQVRLSIIDTSSEANQPFFDASKRFVLVLNGEIFNFIELKEQYLKGFDIEFKTHSDTEVLLHLLIHYGIECLPWLNGFFAFAFYDKQNDYCLIARDRLGKKPLYWAETPEGIFFGSELKSLFPILPKPSINLEAVRLYFRLNYIPPHMSILNDVRKVLPGEYIEIKQAQHQHHFFYKPGLNTEGYTQYSYEAAQSELRKRMRAAVHDRLVSDVPVGAFLSGGIDSSVIVALASEALPKLKTFSIGFNNPQFDETAYAQLVANQYKTEHHVFQLTEADYKEELHHILDYMDEPFADSSCIPFYILCKKTKHEITVALGGDGGDELFGGYHKHRAEWAIRNNALLAFAAKTSAPLLQQLPQNKNTRMGEMARQLAKLGAGASLDHQERYIRWASILNDEDALRLFNEKTQAGMRSAMPNAGLERYASGIQSKDMNEVLLADIQLVLPGDMLQKIDWMSMANSMEIRSPFLDDRVLEFALGIPDTYKLDRKLSKKIVQDSFRSLLPEALYNRPKKGFEVPLLDWFRTDLNDYIFNNLLQRDFIEAQGIFNYEEIEHLRKKLHSANPGYVQATLWALIVFQHWYKKYMMPCA
ncbi:MAG: asparagine synthase (glutamine-hydrolyzing) [Chitinophagaceae bacterium]|nr:asparagine synthase (glutamine-hydrolyzing) [Chitinophagaceae bacterium]